MGLGTFLAKAFWNMQLCDLPRKFDEKLGTNEQIKVGSSPLRLKIWMLIGGGWSYGLMRAAGDGRRKDGVEVIDRELREGNELLSNS